MSNQFSFGPIRYEDVVPLDRTKHGDLAVRADAFKEATTTAQLCPVTVQEIARAALDYPVVFTPGESIRPVVILSLVPGKNGFASEKGWQAGTYVPAAFRRYPFVLGKPDESGNGPFCVDQTKLESATSDERRLFVDGENTQLLDNAIRLCTEFHNAMNETETLCRVLDEHGLFKLSESKVRKSNGAERSTGTYRVIDREVLSTLDDKTVIDFHKRGILAMMACQMASLAQMEKIALRGGV